MSPPTLPRVACPRRRASARCRPAQPIRSPRALTQRVLTQRCTAGRGGFTLIELVVVIIIIGLLAAFAVPRLSSARGRAFSSTLESDLRNLAVAEEAYYYEHGSYTQDMSRLFVTASPGVTVSVSAAGSMGWSATAVHPTADPGLCALFYGEPSSQPAPATSEGQIACR